MTVSVPPVKFCFRVGEGHVAVDQDRRGVDRLSRSRTVTAARPVSVGAVVWRRDVDDDRLAGREVFRNVVRVPVQLPTTRSHVVVAVNRRSGALVGAQSYAVERIGSAGQLGECRRHCSWNVRRVPAPLPTTRSRSPSPSMSTKAGGRPGGDGQAVERIGRAGQLGEGPPVLLNVRRVPLTMPSTMSWSPSPSTSANVGAL